MSECLDYTKFDHGFFKERIDSLQHLELFSEQFTLNISPNLQLKLTLNPTLVNQAPLFANANPIQELKFNPS